MYLGLNVGEVFYGNVGSTERLDFTVVGPAVNEASRIAAMCRSVEQPVLVSVRRTRRRTMRRWAESAGARRWTGCACPPSALMRQIRRVEEGRISGSS